MERALARWPWPLLLRRTGAPTRESPHQVLFRDDITTHLLVFKDHLWMPSCCQGACCSSPPYVAEDNRSADSRIPPVYQAATGRDPPGPGPRRLKRTRTDQPAVPLG